VSTAPAKLYLQGAGHERPTAPLASPSDDGELSFRLWYDTESTDIGRLLASTDNGTSWELVPMDLHTAEHRWSTDGSFSGFAGRRWLSARAELPPGTTRLRWSYASDSIYQGRGVYVDGVHIEDASGVLFNGERPSDAARFQASGWIESSN
jgi:hypothetical protein